MSTLTELMAQKAALEQKIAEARKQERADAVARVRAIVAEHGLTADDVFGGGRARGRARAAGKVAAKYRDPVTGQTWTGRGRAPKWIDGKARESFQIKS